MARDTRLSAFGDIAEDPPAPATPPPAAEPPALSVSAVVASVNNILGSDPRFVDVWIRGEISGFKPASSGHWYFDLKDEQALLASAMFRSDNARVKFTPENGMEVLVRGRVAVYAQRSTLQIVARDMRPVGVGPLQLAFEQMRRRLDAEGLFERERKRSVPQFPEKVAVVTSGSGAVLRDIVRTVKRRFPALKLVIIDTRVQGEGSAQEIARAIARANQYSGADVLVVARGGGSMEDLWSFNEEVVVRAVVASKIPVISAIGHETDFTLTDFAADLRASTPTAAAELVAPDAAALHAGLADAERRLARALETLVPDLRIAIDEQLERAESALRRFIGKEREILAHRVARLDSLSPLGTLARGYAIVRKDGHVVRTRRDAPVGADIEIILPDGKAEAKVTKHVQEE